ncbi:hypothetical protein HPB51_024456 [Rhipicephalus microplus]|uniref:Uncharacterized protein n=1 Tax=Rhipicephalus microplus TaxID=6941 RepID=A0A9J6DE00_RHIMP|nr:hypothetical protein HPB51_024456 [Rhipicephalus microplus]
MRVDGPVGESTEVVGEGTVVGEELALLTSVAMGEATRRPLRSSVLCELCEKHFHPSDFVTSTSYTKMVAGKVIEVPLKLRRLRPGTVLSIFPDCATYLSQHKSATREYPEAKREAEALQDALQESLITHQEEEKSNAISSFEGLLCLTNKLLVGYFWSKAIVKGSVWFLNFVPQDAPVVRCAVAVCADLCLKVYFGETRIEKVGTVVFPVSILDNWVFPCSQNDEASVDLVLRFILAHLEELSSLEFPYDSKRQLQWPFGATASRRTI